MGGSGQNRVKEDENYRNVGYSVFQFSEFSLNDGNPGI